MTQKVTPTVILLAHHLSADNDQGRVLLSVSVYGCLQPQDRWLAGL